MFQIQIVMLERLDSIYDQGGQPCQADHRQANNF